MKPAGEIILDAETNPIDEDLIVNGGKEEKIVNAAKKVKGASVIKGLRFKNVGVIYKDEIGKIERVRIELEVPETEKDWYQPAARKMLSLWFDEQNILPTQVIQVSLPSSGGEEFDLTAEFLDKPIKDFTKKDCVNAAIYYRCRTVASALHADEYEMQQSLFRHLMNLDKLNTEHFLNGESQWNETPFDPEYRVPVSK